MDLLINQTTVNWHTNLKSALQNADLVCTEVGFEKSFLIRVSNTLYINLISILNNCIPEELIAIQDHFTGEGSKCVHLWEDVWLNRPDQVVSRIKSLVGNNKRIHGRKTKLARLSKPVADEFLFNNHLQGAVSSRYKLGLFEKDELVAVATFSGLRKMKHAENYRSAELIRFAVKAGYTVTGGLSKLLQFFIKEYQPDDIMSYADRDWSAGEAYSRLGFEYINSIPAQYFCIDQNYSRKLKKESCSTREVFNTGSLKFILKS